MAFRRGDVILVPFPFSDLSTTKVRPALIVSGELYHSTEPDLILTAITSNLAAATGRFDDILSAWRAAGLRFPSALKPVPFTPAPDRAIHHIGTLAAADVAEIERRLRLALDL